jgi:UDP-glucose 4-epimerase
MKKTLITGGAGFLGLHMIDALLERGARVRVIDNFSCSSPDNLKPYLKEIDFIKGDIRDVQDVKKAVRGVDSVFHFAAIRSVVKTVEDPFLAHEVNATGTLRLLDEASSAGVRRFIFTSTSAVYGENQAKIQREEGPFCPISPYGMAKLLAERYCRYYFDQKKLATTCVRIFNIYGPRQNPESKYSLVVPGVLSKIFKNQSPVIDGSGWQERDFVYVKDVLDALFKILSSSKTDGEVYNLGAGKTYSIRFLVDCLLKLSSSNLKAVHGPRRPGDPDRTCADVRKAKKHFGWAPKTSLEKGLKETIQWYQKKANAF